MVCILSFRKGFEKTRKAIEDLRQRQINAITNQSIRLGALTNKDDNEDDHKYIYQEIFDKLVKETFDEIKELTYEIGHDDLTYCFKGTTAQKNLIISMMVLSFLEK